MPSSDSPEKRAMDEKLSQVWSHPAAGGDAGTTTSSYRVKLSPERLRALEQQQQEAVSRVFRSLRSA
jgi:hypothetical protein